MMRCQSRYQYLRQITRNLFNNSSYKGKAHLGNFSGANIKRLDMKDIVNRIINIGNTFLSYGVKEEIVSPIFIKKQFKFTRIIRQVNDFLLEGCKRNKFKK